MTDDRTPHRARLLVGGTDGDRLVTVTFRVRVRRPTVADLADRLDLSPDEGLLIDGRRVAAGTPLGSAGLADGSLVQDPSTSVHGDAPWSVTVVAGAGAASAWQLPTGVTTIGGPRSADIVVPGVRPTETGVLVIEPDGSGLWLGPDGVVSVAPEDPFVVGSTVALRLRSSGAPGARPVTGTSIPVRPTARPDRPPVPPPADPTNDAPRPVRPTLSVVGVAAPLAMGLVMAVLWSPRFALFAALGPVIAIGTWLEQGRRLRRTVAQQVADEAVAHASHAQAVAEHRAGEAARARALVPDGAEIDRRARVGGTGLWDAAWPPVVPLGWDGNRPEAGVIAGRAIGIVGPPAVASGLARGMVLHLAIAHPPSSLGIDASGWPDDGSGWIEWLPHLVRPGAPSADHGRLIVQFTTDAPNGPPSERASQVILLGLDDDPPPWVQELLCIGPDGRGVIEPGPAATGRRPTRPLLLAPATVADAATTARHLARWREVDGPAASDSDPIPLGRLIGDLGDDSSLADRWTKARSHALDAPIGVADGRTITIDLVADGPHGVIGGTTGSGKSELLRTLVVSIAACHPPDRVNFVLVDYKGGAAFDGCATLPHVATVVTDLDGSRTERVLAGIDAELTRREHWLRSVGRADLAAAIDIDGHPPRLVVVIDEFAIVAQDHPDALGSLVDIARRGRSLGLHLVLATQRPAGAMTEDIRANTDLRIALRMVSAADSSDVIDQPDAARLPADRPGWAIIRRAGGAGERVQVATTSAVAHTVPDLDVRPLASPAAVVTSVPAADTPTELELFARAACSEADRARVRQAEPLWPPDLPAAVSPTDLNGADPGDSAGPVGAGATPVIIGLEDDLRHTTHRPHRWELDEGVLLLHGTRRAELPAVLTGIVTAAHRRRVGGLHLYAVDGVGELEGWHGADLLGGRAGPGDRAALRRLLARLERRLDDHGAGADVAGGRPPVLLVVHDHGAVVRDCDDLEGIRLLDRLHRVIVKGTAAGVHTVMSSVRPGSVPHVVAGVAAGRVVLHLGQSDDYRLLGLRPPTTPLAPGRGLLDNGNVVQLVRANPDGLSASCPCGAEERPRPLGALPQSVPLASIGRPPRRAASDEPWVVPVALGHEGRVSLRVSASHPTVLAGPPASGRTTALHAVLSQLRNLDLDVLLLTTRDAAPPATLASQADRVLRVDELSALLRRTGANDRPVAVALDDATDLSDHDDALLGLVRGRQRDRNVRIVLTIDPGDRRAAYNHWTSALRRCRSGLALWPDHEDGGDLLVGPVAADGERHTASRESLPPRRWRRPRDRPGRGVVTRAPSTNALPSRDVEVHRGPTSSSWLGQRPDGVLVISKVLHPGTGRRARRRLAAQARRAKRAPAAFVLHPSPESVRTRDGCTVWPWMIGRDLRSRLERHGRPDAPWATAIADGIDEAVDALHRDGGVHGALTPDHVLLDGDGRPRLTSLDPSARPTEAVRRMDRAGAAAIRRLLADAGPPSDSKEPTQDLVLVGAKARGPRTRAPLAVGLVITLAGGAVAQAGRADGSPCTPVVASERDADVDGDGCADDIAWSAAQGRLTASTRTGVLTWDLGQTGDRLLVRDWNCDGSVTPGLFRPTTGATFAFSGWPTDASIRADPVDPTESCGPIPP